MVEDEETVRSLPILLCAYATDTQSSPMSWTRKTALSGGRGDVSSEAILLVTEVVGPLLCPQGRVQAPPELRFMSTFCMSPKTKNHAGYVLCAQKWHTNQLIRKKTPLGKRDEGKKLKITERYVLRHHIHVTGVLCVVLANLWCDGSHTL